MKRILTALTLFPSAALAHPGDHHVDGPIHLLTEPDHLAMIAVAAAIVGHLIYRWVRS